MYNKAAGVIPMAQVILVLVHISLVAGVKVTSYDLFPLHLSSEDDL